MDRAFVLHKYVKAVYVEMVCKVALLWVFKCIRAMTVIEFHSIGDKIIRLLHIFTKIESILFVSPNLTFSEYL